MTASDTDGNGQGKKAALSLAVGAVGAGIGLLLTKRPKALSADRVRGALPKLPTSGLLDDVKEKVESLGGSAKPSGNEKAARRRADELAGRRRERQAGRERRRRHAKT
jgi:hypothetical protein